jgi:hypothetical protein
MRRDKYHLLYLGYGGYGTRVQILDVNWLIHISNLVSCLLISSSICITPATPSNDIPSSVAVHHLQRGHYWLCNGFTLCVKWSAISSWSDWRYEKFGHLPQPMIVHCVCLVLPVFINAVESNMNLKNGSSLA